jgi:putative transposase
MSAIMKKERKFFLQENQYEEASSFYSRSLRLAIGKLDLKIQRIRMGNSFRPALLPSKWKRVDYVARGSPVTAQVNF